MTMIEGPVRVQCPVCKVPIVVPAEVVSEGAGAVVVSMDPAPLRAHVADCKAPSKAVVKATAAPKAVVAPPVPAFIAPGVRACLMCGTSNDSCIGTLHKSKATCCAACANGSTHPRPQTDMTCAEWGAEHGPKP